MTRPRLTVGKKVILDDMNIRNEYGEDAGRPSRVVSFIFEK